MSDSVVLSVQPLSFPWQTVDPFLFCVHHLDAYPEGTETMAPKASLAGRNIGMDFSGQEGWSMYHGDTIPGFPQHPHRGFETVTIARRGLIDHSDSLGATARFGRGDTQWLTAGKGIVHSEMFPLVEREKPNPTELFPTFWLNLPRKNKMVEPYFTMLWADSIPSVTTTDDQGRSTTVTAVASPPEGASVPPPPPDSWASDPANEVAIWTLALEPGAETTIPAASEGVQRVLYFFEGNTLAIGGRQVKSGNAIQVRGDSDAVITNGDEPAELLMLQGRPIGEPVAHHGPFVMNEPRELQQAFSDYQRTRFGGWPWPADGPAHPREEGRFALHPDGRRDEP